jgi:hypothetical protein
MAATVFADLVDQSPIYAEYLRALLPEKTALINSGVASLVPLADMRSRGGKTFAIPFYKEFTTAPEILTAAADLTIRPASTGKDIGVVCARGTAMGSEDIAAIFAGDDPMVEFSNQMANYWGRNLDLALVKVASGASAAIASTHTRDYSSANFDVDMVIDAVDLLGDNSEELSVIIMHSKVAHRAEKLNLIKYPTATDAGAGSSLLRSGSIGNRRVIVSDAVPVNGSGASAVYSTFIAGQGAMALFYQKDLKLEAERLPRLAGGTDVLVSTIHFVPHLNYVKWTGTAGGTTPSNTELATLGNWSKVAGNDKDIRFVELQSLANLS